MVVDVANPREHRQSCNLVLLDTPFGVKASFSFFFFLATPHRGGLVVTGGISRYRAPQRRATARAVASRMWVGAARPRV